MKQLFLVAALSILSFHGFAQKNKKQAARRDDMEETRSSASQKRNVLRSDEPLTWLGLDFTQVAFTGSADQYGGAGVVTDDQMREKYIPAWNDLFINEQKKYDVAKYLNRDEVGYALDVTTRANNKKGPKTYFSDDPGSFSHLDEADVARLVKGYDFQGKKGNGVIFFIEGMSKGKSRVSAWVAVVDMGSRTVLQSAHIEGKASGFGFRNFWAGGFLNVLKNVSGEMR